jgi:ActR/RegA family two-component response regulator
VLDAELNKRMAFVLEDHDDLRQTFVAYLSQLFKIDVVSAGGFDEMTRQEKKVLGCFLAILDINLGAGKPSGLDAYRWLRKQGFRGRVAFITGHANNHPHALLAAELGDAQVFAKPVGLEQIKALVEGRPASV